MWCRWTVLGLGLLACQREAGVYVQFVAAPDVPTLETLHLMVLQNGELMTESPGDLKITGLTLPQNILLTADNASDAPLEIVAQGIAGGFVQATGRVSATYGHQTPYQEVRLLLVRPCANASCMLKPATCDVLKAGCGVVEDLAGGYMSCGVCPAGETCGGGGPNQCGTGVCKPSTTCAAAGASCGEVSDGCKLISCGGCTSPAACSLAHQCSCTPTQACPADGGCVMLDDGCGQTLQCGHCGICMPDCAGKACGADDGCGGNCKTGSCPGPQTCLGGTCACDAGIFCNGQCVNTQTDNANCGSCGHSCATGNTPCASGTCVCAVPSDNDTGECCPPGFTFQYGVGQMGKGPYCYSDSPMSAMGISGAEATCRNLHGTCVGFGSLNYPRAQMAVPITAACGSYLAGRGGNESADPNRAVIETYGGSQGSLYPFSAQECGACDGGDSCICSSCNCSQSATYCTQQFYCVTDPRGPRTTFCSSNDDCPGGTACNFASGACMADPTYGCCVSAVSCGPSGLGNCTTNDSRVTGHCQ
jgi:hypothetical protein